MCRSMGGMWVFGKWCAYCVKNTGGWSNIHFTDLWIQYNKTICPEWTNECLCALSCSLSRFALISPWCRNPAPVLADPSWTQLISNLDLTQTCWSRKSDKDAKIGKARWLCSTLWLWSSQLVCYQSFSPTDIFTA